jgi:hypothetical protein
MNYSEIVLKIIKESGKTYTNKNRRELYEDVLKFSRQEPLAPNFGFRNRGGRITSPDVDLALRNLMDCGEITLKEHSGEICLQ